MVILYIMLTGLVITAILLRTSVSVECVEEYQRSSINLTPTAVMYSVYEDGEETIFISGSTLKER